MDKKSLADLKARCIAAVANGRAIARAAAYIAELHSMVGVVNPGMTSPQYMLTLIDMAEKGVKATPKTQPSPKMPEPPKPAPKPEPKLEVPPPPPPEPEVSIEVEAEEAPVEAEEAPTASGGKGKKGKKGK